MAESLTREGPIDVLEGAVGVLRQAGVETLVLHWAGSIPFALAALLFREQVINPRTSDLACAFDALALTLLLLWMNCWRAVFAGRVWRQLSDSFSPRRTPAELFRLVVLQAFAAGTKLLVLPLAALIVFPLPATVAFYRYLAVLADRHPQDPRATLARARHLASTQAEQSWLILPILLFLGLLLGVNLAALLGAAPQLVRILTGYESSFSRSGLYFVTNSTFWLLVLAAIWVLFDPFVQIVYCLRCYQAESRETGEDVRSAVRRLRAGLMSPSASTLAAILTTIVLASCALPCSAEVKPGVLRPADLEKASTLAMRAAEYNWRLPLPSAPSKNTPWIVSVTDRIVASTRGLRNALGRLVERFFSWLGDQLGGAQPQKGALPTQGMHWTVYLLIALVVITAIWMALRVLRSRRAGVEETAGTGASTIRLDADDLTADRLPEERWIELAERALSEQNFRLALRAFYLASLAWMGRADYISIHPGKTNREYELELKRRLRQFPEARALFSRNVTAFEGAWYGLHDVAPDEIQVFRGRIGEMKSMLTAPRGAAQ